MREAIRDPIRFFRGKRDGYPRTVTVHFESGKTSLLGMTTVGRKKSTDGFEWGYSGSGPTALAMALCSRAAGTENAAAVIAVRDEIVATIPLDSWEVPLTRVLDTIARQRSGR